MLVIFFGVVEEREVGKFIKGNHSIWIDVLISILKYNKWKCGIKKEQHDPKSWLQDNSPTAQTYYTIRILD